MPILQVSDQNILQVRRFLNAARYTYKNFGDEDLTSLLQQGIVVLGVEQGLHWGLLGIGFEPRPLTLPADAPNRAFLNAAAFAVGYWPSERMLELMQAVESLLPRRRLPLQITVQTYASWLERALYQVGFELHTQVRPMVLENLQKRNLSEPSPTSAKTSTTLRRAQLSDLPSLAMLDAAAFEPLWHFSEDQLWELLLRGRLQVAEMGATEMGATEMGATEMGAMLVGYASLLPVNSSEMQLARLAVLPSVQGQGIGRQLLLDAIQYTRTQGCEMLTLNTQTDNIRSQTLYRAHGFHFYAEAMSVLVKNYPFV